MGLAFPFPFIDLLTIPVDAGPDDDRVVIGPGDQIAIFNGASLVVFADINGVVVGPNLDQVSPFTSDSKAWLDSSDGRLKLKFPTNLKDAEIRATRLAGIDRLRLEVGDTLIDVRGDDVVNFSADDVQIGDRSLVFHDGSYSGTTDANGFLVVTHGADLTTAGFTPTRVICQSTAPSGGANQAYPVVTAIGATTFTIRYLASAGTSASIAVAGHFCCYK